MALWNRRPDLGVIHHSDQGCQARFKGSSLLGGRHRGLDGIGGRLLRRALAEAFFATLECELLNRQRLRTKTDARMAIFDYVVTFYPVDQPMS
jgi:putative transposase